jgi:hypothetical protein
MIPIAAIGGISKAVDAISSGASWLAKQLSSSSASNSSGAASTDSPSFSSYLTAQGVADPSPGASAIASITATGSSSHGHAKAAAHASSLI